MLKTGDQTENLKILRGGTMKLPEGQCQASLLEAFPNQFLDRPYIINITFPEFTSLCPVTGQPDFGVIVIDYIADKLCVESKSLKLYLFSYRQRGAFMETITNTVLDDLATLLKPCWMRVQGLFAPRGGTRINVYAETDMEKCPDQSRARVRETVANWRLESRINDQR